MRFFKKVMQWKNQIILKLKYSEGCDMKKFFRTIWIYFKRKWWYLILLTGSSLFVYQNRSTMLSIEFDKFNSQSLIFILWIVLLLLPLFSEMEFFGVKLTKEVEKVTSEIKESLYDLKLQLMQLQVTNSVATNIQVGNNLMPSEGKMEELLQLVRGLSQSPDSTTILPDIDDTDKCVYLFKVRLGIETALSDLSEKMGYTDKIPLYKSLQLMLKNELIDNIAFDLISQVIKIANRGVHGEIVSDEYINFVRETQPEIQRQLKDALGKLHYTVCPKCKYTGYSRYENICPECGYTYDE